MLNKRVQISDKALFHVHTFRCNHAQMVDDEAYIKRAIEMGATQIWFTDHAPFPGIISSTRMRYELLGEYIDTLNQLKEKWKTRIEVFVGLEIEFLEQFMGYYSELSQQLDLLVLGQHGFQRKDDASGRGDTLTDGEHEAAMIAEATVAGIRTGLFDVCAHPDRMFRKCYGWTETMHNIAKDLILAAEESNTQLEVNMASIRKKTAFWRPFWEMVPETIGVVYGADAHSLDELMMNYQIRELSKVR